MLGVLEKYTGVATHSDYETMLRESDLDAVLIATPIAHPRAHGAQPRSSASLHVFCEKPFTLSAQRRRRARRARAPNAGS